LNRYENRNSELKNTPIYPVILSVPEKKRVLTGREKVWFLSNFARQALRVSAHKRGITLGELSKNENGAPIPINGFFWSITHKADYVGGVAAPYRIGLDIEKIRPFSTKLLEKTGSDEEWGLAVSDPQILFFRYWTSKEAVLKAAGRGIGDLTKCRVSKVMDENHLIITHENQSWLLEHFFFEDHIASVVCLNDPIQWTLIDDNTTKKQPAKR
jgi:4'-phosphopantetheinyl transferase